MKKIKYTPDAADKLREMKRSIYVFYKIEDKYIRMINIYNEKEDFMWKLFGVNTIQQETVGYWKE